MRRRLHEVRPSQAAHQLDPSQDQEHQMPVLRQALCRQVQSQGTIYDYFTEASTPFLAVKCCSTNLADLFIVLVVRRQYIRPIDNRIFKNRKLLNLILLEFSSSKIFWFSQKYLMSIGNGFNSKTDLKIESKVTNKNISDAKYY